MSNKNMEMMKKIIEEKKKKCSEQSGTNRPDKSIGTSQKGVRNNKGGGLFDK